ncbi:ATP-binding cassette domain-containing protein [Metamycoplasma neophronis]|uniref:ATP-binding cassette domain-containing protein n=1 Tax=Metamycoplasma neophronis TaxID=872983 RepID=A0ABY2Z076_9BACT|nr:ATP-binding cassette domain-containing protein [Metamycoplasma neophronis]TPR53267.1 ATP-binding cassette domain-containing protein [Metamycoplasma neophronis]
MSREEIKDKKVILSIDNLKKYFVNQGLINKAVDGVSFDVHEGEIVGLIGESGSGKTTVGRTLLRLYDDFNGFVKFEDKIISGKRISNRLGKYLRKNVQMIFQDPHASLNGQQNIYSILKEPLLVNGIMKNKIQDIFKDWLEVKSSFKYTFQIQAMQLELQNYREINRLAKPLFATWMKKFENLAFDPNISKEDNFALFYGYLEEKQHVESLIINNMYSNASKLIEFYYEAQNKFRNDILSEPELEYKNAKTKLAKLEKLSKMSYAAYEAHKELIKQEKNLKTLKSNYRDLRKETTNTFNNYIFESKNENSLINISRLMSTDLDYYLYSLKNEKLMLTRKQLIAKIKRSSPFLGYKSVKVLIGEIDEYIKKFYNEHLANISYGHKNAKVITNVIKENFNFKYDKFVAESESNDKKWREDIQQVQEKINSLKLIISRKDAPEISSEQLDQAKAELASAKDKYLKGRAKFLVSYKQKIADLYEQTKEAKEVYLNLVEQQTICNNKYEQYKAAFYEYLSNCCDEQILNLKTKLAELSSKVKELKDDKSNDNSREIEKLSKQIHKKTEEIKKVEDSLKLNKKMYQSDLSLKEDTLKSFTIERKYLERDIENIYILLGIDHKWVENNLKAGEEAENTDARHIKWQDRKKYFDYAISFPVAKYLISELLYKMIIYKALEDVGLLKQFAYRYPHEFSGGQLQRIVIARALITEPKVIVADEPIASLDISIQAQVVNLLKELCIKKNIGLIFIAHDLSMIEYVADNVQIMHLGKIVENGKTEAIYAKPIHPYTINLFKAIPKISNANEKFQNVSFALDYLDEQQFPNVPETFEVGKDHYVYGTKKQVDEWVKEIKNEK